MLLFSSIIALISTISAMDSISNMNYDYIAKTIESGCDSIMAMSMSSTSSEEQFSPALTLDELTAKPSPDVASMTRHIEEGIDYSTGTGGLEIPLYSWKSGDYEMNIGLRYRIGAYKVKERAGWTGLGWNLTGGGCVSRDIIGLPDEKYNTNVRSVDRISADSEGYNYLREIEEYRDDYAYDRYSYTCPGAEGSFIIKSGKIIQLPSTDNVIEFTGIENDGVKDFLITTPDGTKYYFTEREKINYRIIPTAFIIPMWIINYQDAVSAWHLSRIESPDGKEVATYSYNTLPDWVRKETKDGEFINITWVPNGGNPDIKSSSNDMPKVVSETIFREQKILKVISTRTAEVLFKSAKDEGWENDTPEMLTEIRVLNYEGLGIRSIKFDMATSKNASRMLSGITIKSGGSIIDAHEFSYIPDRGNGRDFFGYRNNKDCYGRTIIDMVTGRLSDKVIPDGEYMKARSLWRHRTAMGVSTRYVYEPSMATYVRNGKVYSYAAGVRIKEIIANDTITGRLRKRKFSYYSPACNIDFSKVSASDFVSLSGDIVYKQLVDMVLPYKYYSTYISFHGSSRAGGFAPENATIYYGEVEEEVSGTGISFPIKTKYEYDVNRSIRKFIPSCLPRVSERDEMSLTYSYILSYMYQSVKDALGTGSYIQGSFIDGSGWEPRLKSKTEYEYDKADYRIKQMDRYHYVTADSSACVSAVYHESAIRTVMSVNCVRRKVYSRNEEFCYGNNIISSSRSLLDSVSTVKQFPNGIHRISSIKYFYSDLWMPPLIPRIIPKAIGDTVVGFVKHDNPFKKDTINTLTGPRSLFGTRIREGGRLMEHYTAGSGQISTMFFKKVCDVGQKTLPVREIWIVDGRDTITRTWEYGLFNGVYRPTLIRLSGKGDVEIDYQRISGYSSLGRPLGVSRKGKPYEEYKWGYGGDLLREVTTSGGTVSLSTKYSHTPLVGCTSVTSPDGSVMRYTYKGERLASQINADSVVVKKYSYSLFGDGDSGLNKVVVEERMNDIGTAASNVRMGTTVSLYDGFGLPVAKNKEKYGIGMDMMDMTLYDALHRPIRKWVPIPVSDVRKSLEAGKPIQDESSDVADKYNTAYSAMTYPLSHEERPSSETIPGGEYKMFPSKMMFSCSMHADGKYRVIKYSLQEKIVKGMGYYADGELDCVHKTDGNGNEFLVFTDALGYTVLERRSAKGGGYADTYTISDSWGNPLIVLPPEASTQMQNATGSWSLQSNAVKEYAYIYTYDGAMRMRSRVDAGVRKTEYAYDCNGRLAFSRDSQGRVYFYTYDPIGRPAVSGTCSSSGRNGIWSSDLSSTTPAMTMTRNKSVGKGFLGTGYTGDCLEGSPGDTLLSATYYDNLGFIPTWWNPVSAPPVNVITRPQGLVTGKLLATLQTDSLSPVLSVMYYKPGGHLVLTVSDGPSGYRNSETIIPSVAGLPIEKENKVIGLDGKLRKYSVIKSYDSFGRETSAVLKGTGLPTNGIRLEERGMDDRGYPSVFLAAGKYTRRVNRNVRGKVSSWTSPFVSQSIYYEPTAYWPDKTGKITGKKTVVNGIDRCYAYLYSEAGFLISARYSSDVFPDNDFSALYEYDLNGNIKGVIRVDPDVASQSSSKVETKVSYDGNKMSRMSVEEEYTAPLESRMKINGIHRTGVYYDANGNLETDNYRSIDWIRYNAIGRPEWISMPYDDIEYGYLADGKKYFEAYHSRDGLSDRQRFLIGGLEYVDGSFDRYTTDYGYIDRNGSFHVYIPDYQGNIIGVIDASTGLLEQVTDYYPYGMPHSDSRGADVNRRKFGRKELSTEFGIDMYDFEARQYSLYIPSFNSPDPLAFKTPHISPYSYCHGDPVNYVDPTGMYATEEEAQADINKFYHEAKAYQDVNTGQWYLALNEDGTAAYSGGGTLTKYFGPATKTLMDLMNGAGKVNSAFSISNGSKDQILSYTAKYALKGTEYSNLKGVAAVDKAMGKSVGNYLRVVKGAGWLSVGGTGVTTGVGLYDYWNQGGDNTWVYVKGVMDVGASVAGCFGLWGFALSTLYFTVDLATDGFFIDYSVPSERKIELDQ